MQLNLQDVAGDSHAHLAVQPLVFGSYENTDILSYLKKAGYDLNLKNAKGETPYHLACKQASGRMRRQLQTMLGIPDDPNATRAESEYVPQDSFTAPPDFH